jgi:hypothetical protein
MSATLRNLAFPLRGGSLPVLVAGALLLALASAAGLFGVWLAVVAGMILAAYAFRLLDWVAEGRDRPGGMPARMLSPWHERRPLWLALAAFVLWGAAEWSVRRLGVLPAGFPALLCFLVLPAAVALLGLGRVHPSNVLNPVALARTVAGLGWRYALILVAVLAALLVLRASSATPPGAVAARFIELYAIFAAFSLVGGALYVRRGVLGTETVDSPEQRIAGALNAEQKSRDALLDEAYRLLRAGRRQDAYDRLGSHIARQADPLAEHGVVFDGLAEWRDKTTALDVGRTLISALIAARRSREALAVAGRCLGWSPAFRPARGSETLRLVYEAREAGRHALADRLLADFEDRFPGDPSGPVAASLGDRPTTLRPRRDPGSRN